MNKEKQALAKRLGINQIPKEKDKLQKPAEEMLNRLNIKFIHIRNYYKKNCPKELKGLPDLIIMFNGGKVVFVEFKRSEKDKLKPEQVDWMDYLMINGHRYYQIREFKQFEQMVNRYRWTKEILKGL